MDHNTNAREKVLVWVDDVPNNNTQVVDAAKKAGITVYQPLTTKQALDLFDLRRREFLNCSVRVITDMFRIEENGAQAKYAGEDLIREMLLRNYNVPVLCFTSSDENINRLKESYPHVLAVKDFASCTNYALFNTSEQALLQLEVEFSKIYSQIKPNIDKNALSHLTLVNKETLSNAIVDWKNSPGLPVNVKNPDGTFTQGNLAGWELVANTYYSTTGKLVVRIPGKTVEDLPSFVSYNVSDITPSVTTPYAPWYHRSVKVWKSPVIAQKFKDIFSMKVEGMTATFYDVFNKIKAAGYPVFIVGGAVRDAIGGKDKNEIKDIDMGFGCTALALRDIIIANWKCYVSSISPFGMVQMGDTSKDLYLEGKSINGINNDRVRFNGSPSSIGCDLFAENIYRDFSCNSLWYDPFNEVIVDPTGHGIEDALQQLLRIPVNEDLWDKWLDGNPTKIYRYWKFVARGYTAVDTNTQRFFNRKAEEAVKKLTDHELKIIITKGIMNGKNNAISRLKLQSFRDAVYGEQGKDFYNKYFAKHEPL